MTLETRGLCKAYGGLAAVADIDLMVREGEVLGLIGPNGAGKTTLFNLLAGTTKPDAGQVLLDGRDVTRWPDWKRARAGMTRTFQHGRPFAQLSVGENMLMGTHPLRTWRDWFVDSPHGRDEVRQILDSFGERLIPRIDQPAYTLSYANRRRLEIARALAVKPRILLLDEPTAGMNPGETLELLDFLQSLKAQGQTMVVIEHKVPLILPLADRVVVLDHGTVLAEGSPFDIPRDPRVIAAYLGTRGGAHG